MSHWPSSERVVRCAALSGAKRNSAKAIAARKSAMSDSIELVDGIQHGHDVFHRRSGLDIVHRIEDETAAAGEDLATFEDLRAHLLRGSEGQRLLSIDAAAPEGET